MLKPIAFPKSLLWYPGGILRKVGKLVDKSLALGVSLKKDIITEEEVMAASKELWGDGNVLENGLSRYNNYFKGLQGSGFKSLFCF